MNYALLTKLNGDYRYQVIFDCDYHTSQDDFDPEYAQDIQNRLENGELSAFGVVMSKKCKCCDAWSDIDSVFGILCSTAELALEEYISCVGGDK